MPRLRMLKPRVATQGARSPGSGWQPDSVRGSRHERGYGWEWEKRRERIRERATDLCEPHLTMGKVHLGRHCDHKLAKVFGGSDDDANLHWVCEAFHQRKTEIESKGAIPDIETVARETVDDAR